MNVGQKKINVIGLGYIGLPTALMFAKSGVEVIGTDLNTKLVESLSKGKLTFEEEGLEELFNAAVERGIKFTTEYQSVNDYIIAVPTPYYDDTKKIDPRYLISAIEEVLKVAKKGATLIVESTIPPGTMDEQIRPLVEEKGFVIGEDIHLAHAPERITPGNMIYELENNSRTIGADEEGVAERIKEIYASFCKSEIVTTDIRSAEMSKVVENTYRDVNIAFANELAKICREGNMDVYEIIRIANKHPRVDILQPGPGVGGHCIPIDPWFLVGDYPELSNLILSARKINDSMPEFVFDRLKDIMKQNNIKDVSRVGVYGLTYKENVDDTRESPGLQLKELLEENLVQGVKYYDPFVNKSIVENQLFDFDEFVNSTDVIIVMTAHNHIKNNFDKLKNKHILDTKNVFDNSVHKL
ncbi:nucleotide sugar dehydrogenase [Ruoffia sp. FAM 20857]|uniref:nucleotide sugar dehydrogenase n=1 Tax=Ruoffia sp. FAM 20857 TaxID=3259515 RepID=UPI003884EEC0